MSRKKKNARNDRKRKYEGSLVKCFEICESWKQTICIENQRNTMKFSSLKLLVKWNHWHHQRLLRLWALLLVQTWWAWRNSELKVRVKSHWNLWAWKILDTNILDYFWCRSITFLKLLDLVYLQKYLPEKFWFSDKFLSMGYKNKPLLLKLGHLSFCNLLVNWTVLNCYCLAIILRCLWMNWIIATQISKCAIFSKELEVIDELGFFVGCTT